MVFTFFKRKGDEPQTMTPPKPVVPKPPPGAAAPAQAVQPQPAPVEEELDDFSHDSIIVVESAESHSAVEEAAILYANERIQEAIAVLHGFIKENREVHELHPWLLLFDIFQVQDMHQPFEDLSMEFVVRFERSAPVWEGPPKAVAAKPSPKRAMASTVQFKGQVSAAQAADFQRMLTLAQSESGVKLDLAQATGIDAEAARQLAQVLQSIRRAAQRISVAGAKEFASIVKTLIDGAARQEKAYWGLLFELYQISGQESAFEDAAVDYAVTFELSPPSWEALSESVQIAGAAETQAQEEPEAAETVETDFFSIEGALTSATDYKLRDLERFADTRTVVQIDLTATPRVDFVTVGAFINTLIALNQKGKQVTINGANEMVHALFDVMGVTEYATVVRRKR